MKKYNIIYAESGSNPKVHGKHYEMMTLEEICALPIQQISADNCALFLWVTMPRLRLFGKNVLKLADL